MGRLKSSCKHLKSENLPLTAVIDGISLRLTDY
jgi:hypothetical protein